MDHLLHWLYQNVAGNMVAWVLCGAIAWFWKIKPHFEKLHKHNAHMALRLEQVHKRVKAAK